LFRRTAIPYLHRYPVPRFARRAANSCRAPAAGYGSFCVGFCHGEGGLPADRGLGHLGRRGHYGGRLED
jgi:hypothetical protein